MASALTLVCKNSDIFLPAMLHIARLGNGFFSLGLVSKWQFTSTIQRCHLPGVLVAQSSRIR